MGYVFLWLPEAECSEGSKSQKCLQPLDSMVKKDHPVGNSPPRFIEPTAAEV